MSTPTVDLEAVEQLRAVVRDFLDKTSPETAVRELMATADGIDRPGWQRAAAQLGLAGLVIPEEYGGSSASLLDLGAVFEEAGRALWCAPLLSTAALAVTVLLGCEPGARRTELLHTIADGSTTATLAWGGLRADHTSIIARGEADGRRLLSGIADYVIDGASADVLLVAARTGDGVGLFVVDSEARHGGSVEVERLVTMDSTRKLANLRFTAAEAQALQRDAMAAVRRAQDTAELLLAAEQLGGASRVLDMAVDYANQRVQFGRLIGSFQAVQHKLADVLVEVEFARSVVADGLLSVAGDPGALDTAASLARSVSGPAYLRAASENIQVHGGIGFTWEHPAHLYLKRAKSSEVLLRAPKWHRGRLADRMGIPTGRTEATT
jgi:alkylation response protein AidB-like acyl-CoA dehydrogenase